MNQTSRRNKSIVFILYYSVVTICMTFPGIFDFANRINPRIVGLPFSAFYLFVCVGLLFVGLIVQYRIEDKTGELDLEVEYSGNEEIGGDVK